MAKLSILEIAKRIRTVSRVNEPLTANAKARATATGKKKVARPKTPAPKKGINLLKLIGYTRDNIIKNARRDRVTIVAFKISKSGDKVVSKTLTYDKTKGKLQVRPHRHWIEKSESGPFSSAKAIKVSCDCEHFMFTYEYALTHHNASWIKFSNGEFPIVTNPRLRPGLCKHLYILLSYIKTKKL